MKRLLFFIALSAFGQTTGYKLNVFTGLLDLAGNGFTAPSGFTTPLQSAASTYSVTLAAHGQGTTPNVFCINSSAGEYVSPQILNPGFLGDLTLNFSPAFTGYCRVVGPGANSGAAGDFVGPSTSVSGDLVSFSGTSGKIGADSGILAANVVQGPASTVSANLATYNGTTGKLIADSLVALSTVVKGAAALTTVGAIPIVTSTGTLTQDQTAGGQLFWDATNHRLGVGTNAPAHILNISTTANFTPYPFAITTPSNGTYLGLSLNNGSGGYVDASGVGLNIRTINGNFPLSFVINGTERARFSATGGTGNLLLGGTSFTDGNFKLDVQSAGSSGLARFYDQTATVGTTLVAVRAGAGQSGNLQEWQNNAGTALASLSANGTLHSNQRISSSGDFLLNTVGAVQFTNTADGIFLVKNNGGSTLLSMGASDNGSLITTVTRTITGAVTDAYTAGVSLTPTYTAATAQTVTRHNYINLANPVLSGAGPASLTDGAVFRFDAAAGTHKAVDAGTTKVTPGGVDAWVKVNINGTIYYMPAYTSKTI